MTGITAAINPPNATRTGIVWKRDNPTVATVDKFGVLTARRPGAATIAAYSWDDAYPLAAGNTAEYATSGVNASLVIEVAD